MIDVATLPQPEAAADTPEWHDVRSTGIGASECAAACGLSNHATPVHIWDRKVNKTTIPDNAAMKWGRMLEPLIAEQWSEENATPIAWMSPGVYRHPDHSMILASPDAWIDQQRLLEVKSTTWRTELGEEDSDRVPFEWWLQAQQQMLVTGAEQVVFAVFILDARNVKTFAVERDESIHARIIDRERTLWQCVLDQTPPAVDPNHAKYVESITLAYRRVIEGETVELGADTESHWQSYLDIGKKIKELEALRQVHYAECMLAIGEAQTGQLPCGKALKRTLVAGGQVSFTRKPYVKLSGPRKLA